MSDLKPVRIQGEIFFAYDMYNLNIKFDPDNKKYACTIGNLSDAACEALVDLGIKIKQKDPAGKHITGKSLYKFDVVDQQGNTIPLERIGNGTKVVALVSSYRHKMSSKYGAAPSIKKLIVTELKEYNPERAVEEEDLVL
jgi:hypothetical protein